MARRRVTVEAASWKYGARTDRETDRQTDRDRQAWRQAGRHGDRQTGMEPGQAGRHGDRQADKQTDRVIDRQTGASQGVILYSTARQHSPRFEKYVFSSKMKTFFLRGG